jgi:AGCS family alanine or glycine:cation symporter
VAWHEVAMDELYLDPGHTSPFTGTIYPGRRVAVLDDGTELSVLYGPAVESGAPLTMLGFQQGLPGVWGQYVVLISVLLFAVSTAIAWSYYGDRCANYLFGARAILPYKLVFVAMHFVGAVMPLAVIWSLGDVALAIVIIPNLIALVALSGQVKEMTRSYFERRPWIENAEVHRRLKEAKREGR